MEEDPFGRDGGGASFTCRRGGGDGDGDVVFLLLSLDDNEKGVVGVTLAFYVYVVVQPPVGVQPFPIYLCACSFQIQYYLLSSV